MNGSDQNGQGPSSLLDLVVICFLVFGFDKFLGLCVWLGVIIIPLYVGFAGACFPPAILLWIWPLIKKSTSEKPSWADRIWNLLIAKHFQNLVRFGGFKESWKQNHFWFIWTVSLVTCLVTWLIAGIWFVQNHILIAFR